MMDTIPRYPKVLELIKKDYELRTRIRYPLHYDSTHLISGRIRDNFRIQNGSNYFISQRTYPRDCRPVINRL